MSRARGTKRGKNISLLMDLMCHLKDSELEQNFQIYKGRVVLRSDFVWDDSGSYAVVTEQGPSPSQFMAAKVLDVIARPPGCERQAADAVSAYTQVKIKWRTLQSCSKIPKSESPRVWIRLPRHQWPKSWSDIEDPVVPLERNLCGHPLVGLLWERQFEEVSMELGSKWLES